MGSLTARDCDIDLAELTPIFPAKVAHDRPRVTEFMIAAEDHMLRHSHAQIEIAGQEPLFCNAPPMVPRFEKVGVVEKFNLIGE